MSSTRPVFVYYTLVKLYNKANLNSQFLFKPYVNDHLFIWQRIFEVSIMPIHPREFHPHMYKNLFVNIVVNINILASRL